MKYAWIDAQRREYPLPDMCAALAVSISGYRAWRRGGKPDRTRLSEPQAVALIKSIHAEVKAAYGSRRMHRELQERGHRIGLRRVERLMREHGNIGDERLMLMAALTVADELFDALADVDELLESPSGTAELSEHAAARRTAFG